MGIESFTDCREFARKQSKNVFALKWFSFGECYVVLVSNINLSLIVWGGDLAKWHFSVVSLIQVILLLHICILLKVHIILNLQVLF